MRRRTAADPGQTDLFDTVPAMPVPAQEPTAGAPATDLPDAAARARVARDLDVNLLVEAGAGAGKTTEMVNRMLALVRAGVPVERIAAVTFTRKAAAELRERFQTSLERELRRCEDEASRSRLDAALRRLDRAFLGTIHAFCARLLRERPLEAGVDPGFREVFGPEQKRLIRRFWATHVERAASAGDQRLARAREAALRPDQIRPLFAHLVENPDIEYPADALPRPDAAEARRALEAILDRADIVPRREPENGWDRLQLMVRRLRFLRRMGWSDDVVFLDALATTFTRTVKIDRQYKYDGAPGGRAAAKKIEAELSAYVDPESGPGGRALAAWRAYRYPIAMTFARWAAAEFAAERRRNGTLFFTDLLVLAASLLRANPAARAELGERYRYLLVDEFQDTDPLQAEVLLLLASDPATQGHDWRTVVPRDGALFVVGDPKQSIYRFRRADIALYGQVRERFQRFGAVLELVSNFRSRPPIERFVNAVFEERFPPQATARQAAFAPMRVRRGDAEQQGVAWYRPGAKHRSGIEAAQEDAARLATWVAERIARAERAPGDFLVLTRTRRFLPEYARAFEARNVPIQVTGAGLGIERELSELRLLLEALADPGDTVLTLAVLIGLFSGLDYEALAEHVLDRGGRISFTSVPDDPQSDVERALARLNGWWRKARREPADIVVEHIVEELGLLPFAAGGDLGESRAGALKYVLDAVRRAALDGDATLAGALGAIDAALDSDEAEAPLEPGRRDVLRLMNLHQAKGLEAPVVVLAAPIKVWTPPLDHATERSPDGTARGWMLVAEEKEGRSRGMLVHASPPDWDRHEAEEREFAAAEEDRLLYVACTRAGEELIVARPHEDDRDEYSPWAPLYPFLENDWSRLDPPLAEPPPRTTLDIPAAVMQRRVGQAADRRSAASRTTYRALAVTRRVKGDDDTVAVREPGQPPGRGTGWGIAVHGALEALARGDSGPRLRAIARDLLVAAEQPLDPDGTPTELDELIELVHTIATTDIWKAAARAARSGQLLVEAPFALALAAEEFRTLMVRAGAPPEAYAEPAPVEIVEGIVDLAFNDGTGWILVDYKSDAAGRDIEARRRARYRAQLGLYAAAWERITGEEVSERVLLYTATADTERW